MANTCSGMTRCSLRDCHLCQAEKGHTGAKSEYFAVLRLYLSLTSGTIVSGLIFGAESSRQQRNESGTVQS
jgi:hypothetical protein